MKTAAPEFPGVAAFPCVLGGVGLRQFLHTACDEHRISACRILQNKTNHAKRNGRVAGKVS